MFDKRLFLLVPEAMRFIVASVVFKWLALLANVVVMWNLAGVVGLGLVGPLSALSSGEAVTPTPELTSALAQAAPVVALAICVRAASIYLGQRMGDKAAFLAMRTVRQAVYAKLSALGPSYAETVTTAEAVQTSVEGAQQLQVYFGGYLPQLFFSAVAPLTLFALLVGQATLPAALLIVMVPVIPGSIMAVMRNAKKIGEAYWGSYVDLGGMFLEAVQGLTTLKVYRADAPWHERINKEAERFRVATMNLLVMQLRSIGVMDLTVYLGAALGIIVAVLQLSAGAITFQGAFLIVFLSQEFFLPMRRLGSLFHAAMNGMAASKGMFEILDAPEPERGDAELNGAGDIELEGVGYAYGDDVVLSGVDARVRAGSLVAIVGESGGGKSTLAGIVSGRKGSYLGSVRIDGVELRDATTASLMRAVTLVPTNGYLFAGTLRENLLLAKPDATDDELWAALGRARVEAFVREAGGLGMALAEGGANLSGGQRQRVCMARALLHDSPIYVFDEATSNVDAASEAAIGEVIAGLAGERTVLVVAHRLATVTAADDILVMEGGHLVEEGTHEALLARGGVYARMWESQSSLASYMMGEAAGEASAGGSAESAAGASAESASAADGTPGASADGAAARDAGGASAVEGATSDAASASAPRRSGFAVMRRMMGIVRPLAGWLVLAVALGSAGMLAATFVPAFGAFGLMDATAQGTGLPMALALVLCGVCGVVRGPLHYGEQLCNHYIAFRLLAHVRDLVFGALRRLAPAKLEGRGKGDLVSLVTSDIELLEVFYAHTISPIAIALVCVAVMTCFFWSFSAELALVALVAYAVLGIVVPICASKACGAAGRASRDAVGRTGAFVLDGLRGLAETIQYDGVAARVAALDALTNETGAVDARLQRRQAASEAVADALVLVASLVMLARALALVETGALDFGQAFVATFAFFSSFGPVIAVSRLGASLQNTLASGARVLDLLDERPETPEVTDGVDVAFAGAEASHVSFAYDAPVTAAASAPATAPASGPVAAAVPAMAESAAAAPAAPASSASAGLILDDVSCEFPQGQIVCVSGRSGSGKSTLLKLLMRFWDVTSGEVAMRDGGTGRAAARAVDVRRVNTASLRANEAYMTQDTHLFVGTVRDNLLVARADATDAQLDAACEAAALTPLIERLPKGYDTPVAELGDSLSGGERQRIGLARVFLSDAPFVLLDEPTSALDALNEAAVMQAVARLRDRGKTVVLVSHRASTCAFADRFYSVEHGRMS